MFRNTVIRKDIMFVIFCFQLFCLSSADNTPSAVGGILTIRQSDLMTRGAVQLKGEWEFYWKKYLSYSDFHSEIQQSPDCYINLPSLWKGLVVKGDTLPREGFATYRLRVSLDTLYKPLSIKVNRWTGAFNLYANDKLITSVGKIGTTELTTVYDSRPHVLSFTPPGKEFEFVMQIANFKGLRRSGLYPIYLGYEDILTNQRTTSIAFYLLIFGGIFIIGLCLITIFSIIRQSHKAVLYLGISGLFISFRSLFMGESFFNDLFPHFSSIIKLKLELVSIYCFVIFVSTYGWSLFSDDLHKLALRLIHISHGIFIGITLICSYEIGIHTLQFQNVLCFFIFMYLFWRVGYAAKKKVRGALLFLASLIVFSITAANDILVYHTYLKTPYILHFGFLIFMLIQVSLIVYHHSSFFKEFPLTEVMQNAAKRHYGNTSDLFISESSMKKFCDKFNISNRERDVALLLIEGATNNEIAEKLFISSHTVRRHLNALYKRTNVPDRNSFLQKINEFKI